MSLWFYGKSNPNNECPAVFRDDETGVFYFQGETISDPDILAKIVAHSPVLDSESVVKLPSLMAEMIMEACRAPAVVQRTTGGL